MADQSSSDAKTLLQYEANKKSVVVAYLLLIFLGSFGVHRFYAGATKSGAIMLSLFVLSFILLFAFVGAFGFLILGIWWFVYLFLLHGLISSYNNDLVGNLTD